MFCDTADYRNSVYRGKSEGVRKMDIVLNILRCIAILICIYHLRQADKEITKIVRGKKDDCHKQIFDRFSDSR